MLRYRFVKNIISYTIPKVKKVIHMTFQIRKAERKQAKLRIGLFGSSGSGKTMSALKLARGLTDWNKICILDTENNSADLYSHLGDYNVINIEAPYTPEKYIEALNAATNAGMEVIIIDSITHEWAGKGGILELSDELGKAAKNSFMVWGKLTPRHNAFIDAITSCPVDIICCGRSKQEYVINQQEKNGKMINVPEKVGLKAITREGFDYEMTVSFEIAINHYATTSKDRTGLFMDRPEFIINEEMGKIIKEWNASVKPDLAQQKIEIIRQLKRLNLPFKTAEEVTQGIKDNTELELKEENYQAIINKLRIIKIGEEKRQVLPDPIIETPPVQVEVKQEVQAEPTKTKEELEAEAKANRESAPKPSEAKINLIKSLLEQKEGIKKDDLNTQLGYLMMLHDIEIKNWEELTMVEADRIYQILLKQKAVENK